MNSLNIIVPVFNEENTILTVLKNIKNQRKQLGHFSVIVVDDGSTDKTPAILRQNSSLYTKLITNEANSGKGKAIILGLRSIKSGYVLIQDADNEYDAIEIPRLISLLEIYNADVLLTSRLSGSPITRVYYFWHKLGNHLITFIFNIFNNTSFTDLYSGYLIFRRDLLNVDKLKFNSWGQQAEIITFLVRNSSKVYETPITYRGRTYSEGKKIRANAMFNVLAGILITRIRTMRIEKK